jgi:hypothetical protein
MEEPEVRLEGVVQECVRRVEVRRDVTVWDRCDQGVCAVGLCVESVLLEVFAEVLCHVPSAVFGGSEALRVLAAIIPGVPAVRARLRVVTA